MDTNRLKRFAQFARKYLLEAVTGKLEMALKVNSAARRENPQAVEALEKAIREKGGKEPVADFVAYTWFNRFCALRFMDVMGYNPVRVVSPLPGQFQPEILAEAKAGNFDDSLLTDVKRLNNINILLSGQTASKDPQLDAYKLLVVSVCNSYNKSMPFLFQPIDDYTELLMPDDLLSGTSILALTREAILPEVAKDGIEVIGWLYQFYISEKKEQVMGKTVKTEDIPAATQLFTPHWIVRYLVENSLGRLWMLNHPNSTLIDKMDYYIKPDSLECDFLRVEKPEELRICDPCCGSGHMLTYAFDLLFLIYKECGHSEREIPALILKNNLYGIEIDTRAGELAAFALTMKAREKDNRFLRQKNVPEPNICVLKNIHFDEEEIPAYMDFVGRDLFTSVLQTTLHQFTNADCFGSLIRPAATDVAATLKMLNEKDLAGELLLKGIHDKVLEVLKQSDYLSSKYQIVVTNPPYMGGKGMNAQLKEFANCQFPDSKSDLFAMFIERGFCMIPKYGYSAMVTMQSWMFLSSYEKLRTNLMKQTSIECMAHMENMVMGIAFGTVATVWKKNGNIAHKGAYCFVEYEDIDENNNPIAFPPLNERNKAVINNPDCGNFFRVSADDFKKIPGSPIAYWVSRRVTEIFQQEDKLEQIAPVKVGLQTGSNERFVREWFEVSDSKTSLCRTGNHDYSMKWFPYNKGGEYRKWYGNNENIVNWENDGEEVQHFADEKGKLRSRPQNRDYYFKQSITWSFVSSSYFGVRFSDTNAIFDVGGSSAFPPEKFKYFLTGLLCSKLSHGFMKAMNPTLNFQVGNVASIPVININKTNFDDELVKRIVTKHKLDWNAYERSWDFEENPLVTQTTSFPALNKQSFKDAYFEIHKKWIMQIYEMRKLEIENNRIFIDAYGLQDELASDVPWEEITLTCNPWYRYGKKPNLQDNPGSLRLEADGIKLQMIPLNDNLEYFPFDEELESRLLEDTIKEFIYYSVGCMMGRYSLAIPGLVLANQGESVEDFVAKHNEALKWGIASQDSSDLHEMYIATAEACKFMPDEDNVLPILDGEWFEDDIVARFKDFLKVTFGEENYTENLAFIEKTLGEDIRKYFVKDFYNDHVKRYKKRPIYWLFSSPKGSFNALIYMHRYRPDTVSVVLNDYLREFVEKLKAHREHLIRENNRADISPRDKTKNIKDIEKYARMLAELDDYERDILFPLAQKKISIELDDGVKFNYVRFGDALKKIPGLEAKEE